MPKIFTVLVILLVKLNSSLGWLWFPFPDCIFSCKCLELDHLWQLAEHPKIFSFKLVCAVDSLGWGKCVLL